MPQDPTDPRQDSSLAYQEDSEFSEHFESVDSLKEQKPKASKEFPQNWLLRMIARINTRRKPGSIASVTERWSGREEMQDYADPYEE